MNFFTTDDTDFSDNAKAPFNSDPFSSVKSVAKENP